MRSKSKSKKNILGVVALTIVVIIGLLTFLFVNLGKNSEGAVEYKKQIKEQSATMTEALISEVDSVTQDIKDEFEAQGNQEEAGLEDGEGAKAGDGGEGESSAGVTASKTALGGTFPQKPALTERQRKARLEEALKAKYYEILLEQKSAAVTMLDSLVQQGKADYLNLKASGGWNATAKAALMSDYMSRVGTMEKEMDRSFEVLVAKMGDSLTTEGIDAAPTVEYFKREYSSIKEKNRSAFLDKLVGEIKNKG